MTFDLEKMQRAVDLAVKLEVHAFVLLITGGGLTLAGHKDEGMMVIGAALAIFKGKGGQG